MGGPCFKIPSVARSATYINHLSVSDRCGRLVRSLISLMLSFELDFDSSLLNWTESYCANSPPVEMTIVLGLIV